jgi:hypothetical protein
VRGKGHGKGRRYEVCKLAEPSRRAALLGVAVLVSVVAMLAGCTVPPPAPPDQGSGDPILVISAAGQPFGRYYSEILRAEGLDAFAVSDVSDVSAQTLAPYSVVLLGETRLTGSQASMLDDWVQGGGNLIAMRPDAKLSNLLGLGAKGGTLANGYVKVNTGVAPGAGITGDTMQFHGTADRYALRGATEVASLYKDANSATSNPAVTLRDVGGSGGQAAAFTYDLARSVVYTRQGNPAWAGDERDGTPPIRSDDLFFGAKAGDVRADWVNLDKVAIPQADEQQRLLANLVTQMNLDRAPLPRFWYLPRGEQAAVILTGDDHGPGGTAGQFGRLESASSPGCSVADWECLRSTSYVYPKVPLTDAQAANFQAEGFEIALHPTTGCLDWTRDSLEADFSEQLAEFAAKWPSLNAPKTNRTHCIAWSDWASQPKVELAHGIRLDANYYYWPGSWIQNRPGMFTGSGFPMRFADHDGTMIDVYQAATQLTDESDQDIPANIAALLDGALGPKGYYGAFTANMHTDQGDHPGANAIVAAATARGVPVVSARQVLQWVDGRNASSFQALSFNAGQLAFTVAPGGGANGLEAMVPTGSASGSLSGITRGGQPVATTMRTIKGVDYAFFPAVAGDYVATYQADTTPPDISNVSSAPHEAGTATSADAATNSATSPAPENPPSSFTVPPAASLVDTTVSDFQTGATGSGTYVGATGATGDGEVELRSTVGEEFESAGLPTGWSTTPWGGSGIGAATGGSLVVDGARTCTDLTYTSGRTLEFDATFASAPFQQFGFGVDFNGAPWAMFSTGGGSLPVGLYARTNNGFTQEDTALNAVTFPPTQPHRYRILWKELSVDFFVDGVLVATHNRGFGADTMRPLASDFDVGGGAESVHWLRMSPYTTSGTFMSRVLDSGKDDSDWSTLEAASAIPAGTTLTYETRSGDSATPDATWSAWQAVGPGGAIASPNARYIQYRAIVSSTDATATPTMQQVTVRYQPAP